MPPPLPTPATSPAVEYRLRTELLRGRIVRSSVFVGLLALAMIATVWWLRGGPATPPWGTALYAVVSLGAGGYGVSLGVRRQLDAARGWRLLLTPNELVVRPANVAEFRTNRDERPTVEEVPGVGLRVRPPGRGRSFVVPLAVDGYEQVRAALAGWPCGVRRVPRPWARTRVAVVLSAALAPVAGMLYVLYSDDAPRVVPVGLAVSAALAGCLVATVRSRQVDARTRRTMWMALLPLAAVLWKVVRLWDAAW